MPPFEPPFDDEVDPQVWAMAHQLAFDWSQHGTRALGRTEPENRSDPLPHQPATPEPASGAAVAGASAEARLAVRRFVGVCVEVLNGYRPAAHLRQLSLPGNAAGIVAQALAATQRVAECRRASGRSLRGASRHGRRPDPVAVRSVRLCEPRPGAVEAAVLLITGERTWAVALRLERHQQSWSATTLRLI